MSLTPKQELFAAEYLVDFNATQAAVRAGYSPKTATAIGAENLRKEEIRQVIRRKADARLRGTEISVERVLREYARLAFFDPRRLFDDEGKPKEISSLDDDTAAALVGLDVMEEYEGRGDDRSFIGYTKKYKLADKLRALDALGNYLGLATAARKPDTVDDGLIEALSGNAGRVFAPDGGDDITLLPEEEA